MRDKPLIINWYPTKIDIFKGNARYENVIHNLALQNKILE